MEIGIRLGALRKKRGWTQTEVAKRLSLSSSTICKHEYGDREPNLVTLAKYAELYDVSIEYLLGLIDDESITISMIASMNQLKPSQDALCDKDVADIKRFLRIFRYVLMECLFGMTNSKEGPPSFLYSPQQIAVDNDNLCDMDISDIKRFLNTFRSHLG